MPERDNNTTYSPTGDASPSSRQAVNLRSILIGLVGVVILAVVTPFNNYVINNTDLIGSFLATGLLLYLLVLIAINGLLRRVSPRRAMQPGELAVVIGMMLVASAIPAGGLMRYLPGNLIGIHSIASVEDAPRELLAKLNLPDWISPDFKSHDPAGRGREEVAEQFSKRAPLDEPTFKMRWLAVPWKAWLRPAFTWGLLIASMFGAVLCMVCIFRRQWVENERLPFPIATVYLSLIEPPAPGRCFNGLLSSRRFRIAFAAVFFIHGLAGLAKYFPKQVPFIPMRYDLTSLFSEDPFRFVETAVKSQSIYFTVIGMTYFIQARLAFSLWFIFMLVQVARMTMGTYQRDISGAMEYDQMLGSFLPYALAMLWIARHHLKVVIGQMVRRPREGEPLGRYLPYGVAGWGFLACVSGMIVWLCMAGASLAGAAVLTLMLMAIFAVMTRLVAETGLVYVFLPPLLNRPWLYALNELPANLAARTTLRS